MTLALAPRHATRIGAQAFTGLAVLAISTQTAHAYLDPGAGSLILQMILASALAFGVSVKLFWFRLKRLWQGVLRSTKDRREKS